MISHKTRELRKITAAIEKYKAMLDKPELAEFAGRMIQELEHQHNSLLIHS